MIIRENGCERSVTAAQAFLLKLTKDGLDGDTAAARTMLDALVRLRGSDDPIPESFTMDLSFVAPEDFMVLEPLRIATRLDPHRDTARLALEPWIVEAALARFGEKRLTPKEQAIVVKATRRPWKVRWPDWWEVRSATEAEALVGSLRHPDGVQVETQGKEFEDAEVWALRRIRERRR